MKYTKSIPLDVEYIRMIAAAIPDAYYLYKEHFEENNFPTDNGREGEIWNYINKCISDNIPADQFQIVIMNRGRWKFLAIFDKKVGYLYTLMREKNLANIQKKISEHLFHYLNALSTLNDDLASNYELVYEQLTLFNTDMYNADQNTVLEKILTSMTRKFDSSIKRYVLIAFDNDKYGMVGDIKGIIPAKGLNFYKEENWTIYLDATYDLTETSAQESIVNDDVILLQRKANIKRVDKEKVREKNKMN
ncbi:MAG: DUF5986 family protein [Mobilitalea sp.]